MMQRLGVRQPIMLIGGLAVTLSMSALAAGLTVGGKACGKSFAIGSSTTVVRTAATILHFFHTIPEKLRPKRKR